MIYGKNSLDYKDKRYSFQFLKIRSKINSIMQINDLNIVNQLSETIIVISFIFYNIRMKALGQLRPDPTVDEIIEKVLIRSKDKSYNYIKRNPQKSTAQQYIWHYELQEENNKLKQKIKEMSNKYKKKQNQCNKNIALRKEVQGIKQQLEEILNNNSELQTSINNFRIKNQSINESIRQSFDDSIKRQKGHKECSCKTNQNKEQKRKIASKIEPHNPVKEILKTKQDVSINCTLGREYNYEKDINQKKKHIQHLKTLIQNQKKIIQSYETESGVKLTQTEKRNTMASANLIDVQTFGLTSQKISKPLLSVGSIVRIKRN